VVTIDTESEDGWSVDETDGAATIHVLRDLDADDAFTLRAALTSLAAAGCRRFVFDVAEVGFIAHSPQVVIRDLHKGGRGVAFTGLSSRLRRTLASDRCDLLSVATDTDG
jgi:hypothetical protein